MYQTELREKRPTPAGRLDSSAQTYVLVSKVAYLAGVERRIFENEYEPPKMEYFSQMDGNPNARIIRNLSMLRTAIEQNYSELYHAMRYDLKNLDTLPALIPTECLTVLKQDGIPLVKANHKLNHYIIDINRHIANRINLCKDLFPLWLNWSYLRELFLMPDGYTESGIKRAANTYYAHKYQYPYQVYLNWSASNEGNILYNDKKFVSLLYERHEDRFSDFSKVSDAGFLTKEGVFRFAEQCQHVSIVVDCENADPYKLCGMLYSLEGSGLLPKVEKIVLYDDVHTTNAWKVLDRHTSIPVEHHMTKRIMAAKSLVDIQLAAGICREYYEHSTDGVILVSSDSDYWGLISMMPQIRFLVLFEQAKCGQATKDALGMAGTAHCCIDCFGTGDNNEIMTSALLDEVQTSLSNTLDVNLRSIFQEAYKNVRANMSSTEIQQFYSRYLKPTRIAFAEDGRAVIKLGQ